MVFVVLLVTAAHPVEEPNGLHPGKREQLLSHLDMSFDRFWSFSISVLIVNAVIATKIKHYKISPEASHPCNAVANETL